MQGRAILFRSYLVIVGGLLLVSLVLDAGFSRLQKDQPDQFLRASFNLMEERLAATSPSDWPTLATQLSEAIDLPVQILESSAVMLAEETGAVQTLVNDLGETSYLYRADGRTNGAVVVVGPIGSLSEPWWVQTIPTLSYLSIFVLVGLWLRPVVKDLNLLTQASQQFAQDYREPLTTATKAKQLTGLARNLDDMSSRISHLIQSQNELSAALSHEMRTPLARIRMAMAVLANKADDETRQSLQDVGNDIQEIDQLIASMLSYARLDHPDTRMCWQHVPANEWLELIVGRSKNPDRSFEIICSSNLDSVWIDARLMEIALSNLIVNAMRYASAKVRITLTTTSDGNQLSVEDDGEGIPEDALDTVFKALKRLDSSRNRDTGGFGLGLAIVARIAELHGGRASA
jgi:two-component system OmpR family sensor kinase